ncbi:MAG: Malonyl-CoA decarboxylase [Hyphomicrobiales bacterium]|nr:Malonyl-CoA decarboxylase [Hyphomicrobiales bacterium]
MNSAFFSDLLTSISDRGRTLLGLPAPSLDPQKRAAGLADLCDRLLSGRGEASGTALAREVLDRYATLDEDARTTFFSALAERFGPDASAMTLAVDSWAHEPTDDNAARLHYASEPRRQEIFRRLNRAPGGTAALVGMREDLLKQLRANPGLKVVDRDFVHLLNSWFNRGFLVLRRIDWSSPAVVLEKIIRYEAVHQIRGWDDLRGRIDPVDRRCYAFFHPALVDEPLIFVEIALTADMPGAVQPLLAPGRQPTPPEKARTAVFYSISNCQQGLAGVSFGNFLIKQVVEELRRELPQLDTFVTLSPVPGFMGWLRAQAKSMTSEPDKQTVESLDDSEWPQDEEFAPRARALLEPLAAQYFLEARTAGNRPVDPVARFHLGNGARLERINWLGDTSEKGLAESAGVMVNYLYDLDQIEENHEAFANQGEVVASPAVRRLLKSGSRVRLAPAVSAKA